MTTKERLIGLLKYVEELARIPEKPIYSVRSYRSMLYFEHQLRGRVGIQHDVVEDDGTAWLRIERLQRESPPIVAVQLAKWIVVSRDPGSAPQIQNVILETMKSTEAQVLVEEGKVDTQDVMPSARDEPDRSDVRLRLDRYPEIESALKAYVTGPWRDWSEKEKIRRETIAIYDKFFATIQSIETEGADNPIEIVLGLGIALWQVNGKTVEHPLIEALVEIDIDQETHAIRLRPRDADPQLYVRPFGELGTPRLAKLEEVARKHFAKLTEEDSNDGDSTIVGFSPFVPASFQPLLEQAASQLSSSGIYAPRDVSDRTVPKSSDTLTITDTWAIYVRPRSANLFVQDIQRLKKDIESREEGGLPSSNKRWVSEPVAGDNSLDSINLGLGIGQGGSDVTSVHNPGFTDRDVLFPKPFNKAQIEIVSRLAQDDGVVVQGPPGTGKTHTIANIICHYLASGRSVLVVSKGEPALEVLRDQIPEEVRGLTISLLTNERQGLKQLEAAVTFMANHVVSQDAGQLDSRRQEYEREVLRLRGTIQEIDAQMQEWAKKHLTPVAKRLAGSDGQFPAELAKLVIQERESHGWLDDKLGIEDSYEPQFTDQDISALRDARRKVGADLIFLGMDFPCPNDLPGTTALGAIHEDLRRAANLSQIAQAKRLPPLSTRCGDAWSRAAALLQSLREISEFLQSLRGLEWLVPIYRTWLAKGIEADSMVPLCQLVAEIGESVETQRAYFTTAVTIPPLGKQREDVIDAVRRANKGERPFPLLLLGKGEAKDLVRQIRVNRNKPETQQAWQEVLRHLEYQDRIASLFERWNKIADTYGLPITEYTAQHADKWLSDTKNLFENTQRIVIAYRQHWRDEVSILFPHGIDRDAVAHERQAISLAIESLESSISQHKLATARSAVESAENRLATCSSPITDAARRFLREVVGSTACEAYRIADQWRDHLRQIERLRSLRPQLDLIARIAALVEASGAANWARRLRTEYVLKATDPWTLHTWDSAWRHRRLEAYLGCIDGRAELKELSRRRIEEDRRLAKVMTEVVQLRTYLGLKQRMRGGPLAALIRFAHAIRQIGAGTGVRAQRFRGDARRAMLECIGSVPCWIMPTWRVSEALPAQVGIFDLIIIDEASQSDAMALPALLRAKKVLVVGDDRQVSPSPIGLEERRLLKLRHSHLQDQPFADMLMPGTSLYDLAQAVFPGNRILLNEHFRCVEPIIRFSFQFYPERIIPVRIPKPSERLDPPLVDVLVCGGQRNSNKVNEAEAQAIVYEIERIVNDPVYDGRTIGIVSLIGNQQAHRIQEILLDRIGEDTYLRFRIACGDAATFQGKERNIMFISMVASPGQCHAQMARLFEQRFNVALSRARDRMYLFRSVTVDDLHNVNDLKRRVLNHFQAPMPAGTEVSTELIGRCDSQFERDVFRRLSELGYRVTPQVSVGEYRIDLVVDGEADRRLAIELDGDRYHGPDKWFDDWNRQKLLERVGWTFWRCWASSFALAPDECMADLLATLTSMGIQPIGQTSTAYRYTEHRTIQATAVPSSVGGEDLPTQTIQVGDAVVLSLDKDEGHHRLVTLSPGEEDLDNGIIAIRSEAGKALLGRSVEDEVDLAWKGENRHATILSIEKPPTPSMDDVGQVAADNGSEAVKEKPQRAESGSAGRDFNGQAESLKSLGREKRAKSQQGTSVPINRGQQRLFEDRSVEAVDDDNPTEGESPSPSKVVAETDGGGLDDATKAICQMTRGEFHRQRQSNGFTNPAENARLYWQAIKKAIDVNTEVHSDILREYERIFGNK